MAARRGSRRGRQVAPMIAGIKSFARPLRALFIELGFDRREVKLETYDLRHHQTPLFPSVPLLRQIFVDGGDFYDHFGRSVRHTLAPESGLQSCDGGFV